MKEFRIIIAQVSKELHAKKYVITPPTLSEGIIMLTWVLILSICMILVLVLSLHACQIVLSRIFFFFFSFIAQQDYFTPFEPSQLVGKTKTGDPWEKHMQPNPQAELS